MEASPPEPDVDGLRDLLAAAGHIDGRARVEAVTGGVSSTVVAVVSTRGRWLAKTPLERLAVAEDWPADRARAWREAAALTLLAGRVGPVRVPRLLFFDARRLIVGMELIGAPAPTWKSRLLAGVVDTGVGRAVGAAAAALHRLPVPAALGGAAAVAVYRDMRLEPYYATTARRVPALAPALAELIADTTAAERPRTLVHGDLNPKNVLVTAGGPALVDWELAHAGDPAFDLAMPVAHLLLKAAAARQTSGPPCGMAERCSSATRLVEEALDVWDAYDGPADRPLALRHVGAVMASRLYGKSPVDYLPDPARRAAVMAAAARALQPGSDLEDMAWSLAACRSGSVPASGPRSRPEATVPAAAQRYEGVDG